MSADPAPKHVQANPPKLFLRNTLRSASNTYDSKSCGQQPADVPTFTDKPAITVESSSQTAQGFTSRARHPTAAHQGNHKNLSLCMQCQKRGTTKSRVSVVLAKNLLSNNTRTPRQIDLNEAFQMSSLLSGGPYNQRRVALMQGTHSMTTPTTNNP